MTETTCTCGQWKETGPHSSDCPLFNVSPASVAPPKISMRRGNTLARKHYERNGNYGFVRDNGPHLTISDSERQELATLRDEERSAFDNMPESIQQGEKGSAAEQAADDLDEAHDEIESACGTLEGIE